MNFSIDTSAAKRMASDVRAISRQAAFANVVALTRTAVEIKAAEQEEMRSVFDRPTPFTLNAIYVKAATKSDPEARVGIKDGSGVAARTVPPNKYLAAEVEGGGRRLKSFEKRLQDAGAMPRGWFAVPGSAARLDGNGNLGRGQITAILSQLRSSGFVFPTTNDKRAIANFRRSVTRAGGQYFALPVARGKMPPGIYLRAESAFGRAAPRLVVLFVKSVAYRRLLDFDGVARRTAEVFFDAKLDEALAQYAGPAGNA
jgi:hypothetical protein